MPFWRRSRALPKVIPLAGTAIFASCHGVVLPPTPTVPAAADTIPRATLPLPRYQPIWEPSAHRLALSMYTTSATSVATDTSTRRVLITSSPTLRSADSVVLEFHATTQDTSIKFPKSGTWTIRSTQQGHFTTIAPSTPCASPDIVSPLILRLVTPRLTLLQTETDTVVYQTCLDAGTGARASVVLRWQEPHLTAPDSLTRHLLLQGSMKSNPFPGKAAVVTADFTGTILLNISPKTGLIQRVEGTLTNKLASTSTPRNLDIRQSIHMTIEHVATH